jgi:hypothetical protein
MHVLKKVSMLAATGAAAAISIALAIPAHADTAATGGDALIVGSDTVQNAVNFALDGSPGVLGGYNSTGNLNRGVSLDANGDANGRGVYDGTCTYITTTQVGSAQPTTASSVAICGDQALEVNSTTTSGGVTTTKTTTDSPNLIGGSAILRAGTAPVIRPNGSGAGIQALVKDAPGMNTNYQGLPAGSIQIARASRLPNPSGGEADVCTTGSACGGLHVYQIATDDLRIAHQTSAYNGPAAISTADLVKIYTCVDTTWNQLTGNTGGSTATIHPLIPQTGSGTRNFFLADLQAANNGTVVNPGTCVRTVQEHDPSGIFNDPSPADAIEPFSSGKVTLLNSGYFTAGATGSPSAAAFAKNYLTTLTATGAYDSVRGLYLVVRQEDVTSSDIFQPGGLGNFTNNLITASQSAVRSGNGMSEIAAAGFTVKNGSTPVFKDCGINPSSC